MAIKIQGVTVVDDTGAATFTNLTVDSTGAIRIPVGTTAQQPAGAAGDLRFDSDLASLVAHNGIEWTPVGGADDFARTLALLAV